MRGASVGGELVVRVLVDVEAAPRKVLVTARDQEWLAWLGRWRAVTAAQVAAEFERRGESAPLKKVEQRLRLLGSIGLVHSLRLLATRPRLHSLTVEGMRLVGLEGAAPGPKLAETEHDLEVVELAASLMGVTPDWELVTEREVRRLETPNQHVGDVEMRYSVRLPEARQHGRVYPDIVTVSPQGAVWVHELEWSPKEHRRLVRLMMAYQAAPHITGARYYCGPRVRGSVRRAADEVNAMSELRGGLAHVKVADWPDEGGK